MKAGPSRGGDAKPLLRLDHSDRSMAQKGLTTVFALDGLLAQRLAKVCLLCLTLVCISPIDLQLALAQEQLQKVSWLRGSKVTPPGQARKVPPTTSQSPSSLTFTGMEGGTNPATQTLNITNTGGATLSWTVSETAGWLSLSAASGTTTTETDAITVTVNIAGLTTNTYTAPISITADGASNTPQQVLVTLAITAPVSTKAKLTWDPNTES